MEIDKNESAPERGIVRLSKLIEKAERIVFFGGAGTSTESGIRDFRGEGGLYSEQEETTPPEEILSHSFFLRDPETFYRYYRRHFLATGLKPNACHEALARLEKAGRLTCVVTQNIDGLHEDAGSVNVQHLHGTVTTYTCMHCRRKYPLSYLLATEGIPHCGCGGIIRPDVVLYGENLPAAPFEAAAAAIAEADLLLVGGTSLTVYPAAGLIRYFRGSDLVILNKQPTPYDEYASLILRAPIGKVLGEAVRGIV